METRNPLPSEVYSHTHIAVYTADTIKQHAYENMVQDSLRLLREGVYQEKNMYGEEATARQLADYIIEPPGFIPVKPDPKKKDQKIPLGLRQEWQNQIEKGDRSPFLLVAWNIIDGPIGALEGRRYIYNRDKDLGKYSEPAIFINWIVVKNQGTNDDDRYSYRGQGEVGVTLYKQVEQMAEDHGIPLIIAGVHIDNKGSVKFHEKMGFHREVFCGELNKKGEREPYPTESGSYIPGYRLDGSEEEMTLDEEEISDIPRVIFFTRRLAPFKESL